MATQNEQRTGTEPQRGSSGQQQRPQSQSQAQSQAIEPGRGTRGGGLARQSDITSPFGLMRRLMEDMDRVFGGFGLGPSLGSVGSGLSRDTGSFGTFLPDIEVLERGSDLVVRCDLPGMKPEDVNVEIQDGQLILSGERRDESEESREGYYHSERSYGRFQRAIPLPDGLDPSSVEAKFENGVLEITAPMPKEASRGRRIEVKGGGQTAGAQPTTGAQAKPSMKH